MKIKKRIFEETYCKEKLFRMSVNDFKHYDYFVLSKEDKFYYVSFNKPNHTFPYDYVVLDATLSEMVTLKRLSLESVRTYLHYLNNRIWSKKENKEPLQETFNYIVGEVIPAIEELMWWIE